MRLPNQSKPMARSVSSRSTADGVTPSGIACTICQMGCNQLSGIAKTLCMAACDHTVC